MNFIKKNLSSVLNLVSVLLIVVSIESLTSNGLIEGRNTFYKTISFSRKPFNLYWGDKVSYTFLNALFFIGLIILTVSAIKYCEVNKTKGIISIVMDIIFSAFSFVLFLNGNYLLMTMFVITLFTLQISLQSSSKNKLYNAITVSSSIGIWIITIYFLVKQFTIMIGVTDATGVFLDDLIKISRTNAICLSLFIVPCITSIIGYIKSQE